MSAPLVSVVIPAFNAADTLNEALASVARQTWQDWEALVVDDGSCDSTADVVRAWVNRDPRIRLLTHAAGNRGVGASRNLAVASALGEVICFLDADDQLLPDSVGVYVQALREYPSAGLVYGMARAYVNGEAQGPLMGTGASWRPVGMFAQLARFNTVVTSAVAVRRAYLPAECFPVGLPFQFEDWACWLLLSRQVPFLFVPELLALYRRSATCATVVLEAGGRMPEYAAAQGRFLRYLLRDAGRTERAFIREGQRFRAAEATLRGLSCLRRGDLSAGLGWLRAAVAIAGHPMVGLATLALLAPEHRRALRGEDPRLTLLPPPEPAIRAP